MTQLPDGFVLDTAEPSQAPAMPEGFVLDQPSMLADVAKSAGIGLAKGAVGLLGLPGDLRELVKKGAEYILPGLAEGRQKGLIPDTSLMPTSHGIQGAIEDLTGKFYEPKTTAGKYAQTIGEFAPAALGPGGVVRKAANVVLPGVASEAAGQATKDTKLEPWARMAGALAGAMAPAALSRIATPLPADPLRTEAVNILKQEGVTPTAGQATGRTGLQLFESRRGGGRIRAMAEKQADDFTRATLRRVGEDANRATPEVIDRAYTRIGSEFDRLAANNVLQHDQKLTQDLVGAVKDYTSLVGPSQRAPIIENTIDDIVNGFKNGNGQLSGEAYQAMRSRLTRAARGTADPELKRSINDIVDALDSGMQRSMLTAGNTKDAAAWRKARSQYRNMLVLEKSATGAGQNAALGVISPSALRNSVVNQGRRAYARGQGDMAKLARSGEAVLRPFPSSGTAERLDAQGGIMQMMDRLPFSVAGRFAVSRPMQAYLANQMFRGPTASQQLPIAALLESLMAPKLLDGSAR